MSERRPRLAGVVLVALVAAGPALAQGEPPGGNQAEAPLAPAGLERLGFDAALKRALERNPGIRQAAQAILRVEALLDQARSVFRPSLYGFYGTTVLDDARGFDGNVTQPRTQSVFNATVSFPVLAAARWTQKNQAADQVGIARLSAEETRRQVALLAARAYLAVVAAGRQREIALRNLETARALDEYAQARLDSGKGSRLNHVRSTQERVVAEGQLQVAELALRQAQEALGVAVFADVPVDADGDPELPAPVLASDESFLGARPDVRLFEAQAQAAERVARDAWTSWMPTATASFTPQYVTPAGFFEPAKTWRAVLQVQVPLYDGTLGAGRRVKLADRETARVRLDAVTVQARAEVRLAQEAVVRTRQIVDTSRRAAESAAEALRITEVAYRAGAASNIEVVQAQQTARNTEIVFALAEDRLRLARLDLLVALGQFPR
jgi:outer membrane protein TolC